MAEVRDSDLEATFWTFGLPLLANPVFLLSVEQFCQQPNEYRLRKAAQSWDH